MSNQQCCCPLDSQLLIKAIQTRPPLWNKTHVSHKDTDVVETLWNEVSDKFKSPKEILKSRWKGLRDTFRKEFKKPGHSRWIHYKNLLFLEDMMITERNLSRRRNFKSSSSSNSSDSKSDSKGLDKADDKDEETVPSSEDLLSNYENDDDCTHSNDEEGNDIIVSDFAATEMVKTEIDDADCSANEKPSNTRKRTTPEGSDSEGGDPKTFLWNNDARYFNQGIDDDYHFFMSLIPHVKSLPLDQKLILRMKMQEIIYNEIFSTTDQPNCNG